MVKKTLLIITISIGLVAIAQQYTNVLQVLNIPLTEESMGLIVTSDRSTPERLFLSFLKSSVQGDLPAFLSVFTDTYLASEFGVIDKSAFTNGEILDFRQFLNDSSITNRTLVSYSCAISGNVAKVSARISLRTPSRSMNEDVNMCLIQTNGAWKISQWQE